MAFVLSSKNNVASTPTNASWFEMESQTWGPDKISTKNVLMYMCLVPSFVASPWLISFCLTVIIFMFLHYMALTYNTYIYSKFFLLHLQNGLLHAVKKLTTKKLHPFHPRPNTILYISLLLFFLFPFFHACDYC